MRDAVVVSSPSSDLPFKYMSVPNFLLVCFLSNFLAVLILDIAGAVELEEHSAVVNVVLFRDHSNIENQSLLVDPGQCAVRLKLFEVADRV